VAGVDASVVRAAEQDLVVEVGHAAVSPVDDVVDVTPDGRTVTAGVDAVAVADGEGLAVGGGRGAAGAADVEG